ncbi:uncharacterized protein LOC136038037 isoform X1 [Artemia franciscana]
MNFKMSSCDFSWKWEKVISRSQIVSYQELLKQHQLEVSLKDEKLSPMIDISRHLSVEILILKKENQAAGFCVLHNAGEDAVIFDGVYILPEIRRQGYCMALLDYIESHYDKRNITFTAPISKSLTIVVTKHLFRNESLRIKYWILTENGDRLSFWISTMNKCT